MDNVKKWLLLASIIAGTVQAAGLPEPVKRAVAERVEFGLSQGIVIGYADSGGVEFFGHGTTALGKANTPDRHTIFEIGSITKVFTATLLADAVAAKRMKLDDPVTRYLPSNVAEPLGKITLKMLATHHSGLPRMPANYPPPYFDMAPKGYTNKGLYEFLREPEFVFEPDSGYHYSNVGFGLLGHLLERESKTPLPALLKDRLTGKLGMNQTAIGPNNVNQTRLAQGHHGTIKTPYFPNGMLDGTGALLSSADDLMKFLQAHLADSPPAALTKTLKPRKAAWDGTETGLAWHIKRQPDGSKIHWHNGSTGGFYGFIGMDLASKVAVVVLANSGGDGHDDIGHHLLDPSQPLLATPNFKETSVTTATLDQYVGIYDTGFGVPIEITRVGNQLKARFGEQFALNIHPRSKTEFFYRAIKAEIHFGADANQLFLLQDGERYPAKRRQSDL